MAIKKGIILLGIIVMILSAYVVWAQPEGVITYETRMNMWKRIPPEREAMKNMIPEFMVNKAELFHAGRETMYKPIVEEEEDAEFSSNQGGRQMRFKMAGPSSEIYINYDEQICLAQEEFNGKKYLITDSIRVTPWKFGTETKEILGYTCKQAFYTDDERDVEVVAWYSDQLGMFVGPDRYGSLPGTILAVDINNGERTIIAIKKEQKKLGKHDIKAPSGGTPITRTEFNTMMRAEMERRGAASGGGGTFIIRND